MRKRLIIMTMSVILLAVAITGIFIGGSMQRLQKESTTARLLDLAQLLLGESGQQPADENQVQLWANELNREIQPNNAYRITVISADGQVVSDSQMDAETMANHAGRPEIQQALSEGSGSDVRQSVSTGELLLYAAQRSSDGSYILRISLPMHELQTVNQVIYVSIAMAALLSLAVAYLLCFSLANRFLRPISQMRQAASRIAQGDYNHRIPAEPDELGFLATDFNRMTAALAAAISREKEQRASITSILQSTSTGIVAVDDKSIITHVNPAFTHLFDLPWQENMVGRALTDYTRSSQLQQMIADTLQSGEEQEMQLDGDRILQLTTAPIIAEDQLKGVVVAVQDSTRIHKLEQMRSEFVANVTHELKTPLTSIRGYIETLKSGIVQDPNLTAEMLEIIDIQSQRLQNLIADLLTLSEIENGDIRAAVGHCDVGDVLDMLLKDMQPLAQANEVKLTCQKTGNLELTATTEKIYRLLANLVENGIKYNRPGGSVTVEAQGDGKVLTIQIRDTGIGIPPEHQERIFERFYRVDTGRSRAMGGTGLGLSIVKHLVQLYGGSIQLNSNPDEGSLFTIKLPQ